MTYPSGETPAGAVSYSGLESFGGMTGSDFIHALIAQVRAAAGGWVNLQAALNQVASQIGFPEFAELLLAAFEGIIGSFFDFLPWFINLTTLLGFDLMMDPADFNLVAMARHLVSRFINLVGIGFVLDLLGLGWLF